MGKTLLGELDRQSQEIKKIRSPVYKRIYENRLISVCNQLLLEVGFNKMSAELIRDIMFQRVMNRLIHLEGLSLYPAEGQAPNLAEGKAPNLA